MKIKDPSFSEQEQEIFEKVNTLELIKISHQMKSTLGRSPNKEEVLAATRDFIEARDAK